MNLKLIMIFIFTFVVIVGGGGLAVYLKLQTLEDVDDEGEDDNNMNSAQQFLPFKEVRDGVIDLGNDEYRAVIECSSTNYSLKTENEKKMIEASFQRFINSLTFPITIFIQTKTMNNTEMLEELKEEIKEVSTRHPLLENYGNGYYQEMVNLENYTENNRQKKKYIIIPYNEAHDLEELNDKEIKEHSISEVKQRALMLIDSLGNMEIKGQLLDTAGLAELIYSSYHKDNYGNVKNLINGEFLSLLVEGDRNPQQEMNDDEKMTFILHETKQRIKTELLKPYMSEELTKEYREALLEIEKLEKQFR